MRRDDTQNQRNRAIDPQIADALEGLRTSEGVCAVIRINILLILLGTSCAVAADAPTSTTRCNLRLDVSPACAAAAQCSLQLILTNEHHEAVSLNRSLLPWRPNAMLIVASENRGSGESLELFRPVDDPGPDMITILPGGSVTGVLHLNSRFRGFAEALKRADVVVWWMYRPYGRQPLNSDPLIGGVLLRKRD